LLGGWLTAETRIELRKLVSPGHAGRERACRWSAMRKVPETPMPILVTVAFFAVLVACTLLAIGMWYAKRGADVPAAERKVFGRFVFGLIIFWLIGIAAYLWGPLHPQAP
jgi:hypothetical protein